MKLANEKETIRRLVLLREHRGMTMRQLADAAGLHENTISNIEHGLKHPRIETLAMLADALGVDLGQLISEKTRIAALRAP